MTGYIDQQGPAPAGHRLIHGVRAWLAWHAEMGMTDLDIEESVAGAPARLRHSAPSLPAVVSPAAAHPRSAAAASPVVAHPRPAPSPPAGLRGDREAIGNARRIAAACRTLDELRQALEQFEGCALKDTATRLCFADGAADARIMVIGEAPGSRRSRPAPAPRAPR